MTQHVGMHVGGQAGLRSVELSHPPQSPVLAEFGAGFAAFVEAFEPARIVPYLADVARLEMAWLEAFHAADAPALSAAAIEQALGSGADIARVVLQPHPSLRLVASRHPVFSIWAAHQAENKQTSPHEQLNCN